jgi:hypothetical protein
MLVRGSALFPALLRTIHLGHITLSLERKVEEIGRLLDVTSAVTGWSDEVLERLGKEAGTFATTIDARACAPRAVGRAEILMGKLNALRCLDHHHAVLCWVPCWIPCWHPLQR